MEQTATTINQHPIRVLIAERHRTIAESLGRVVSAVGSAEVAAMVTSATEAIEVGGKIAPDVAIIDLELSPSCALVTGLAALSPETRIIVMADRGGSDAEGLVKALSSGAVGAIYKETSVEDLGRALAMSSRQAPVMAEEAAGLLLNSYLGTLQDKRTRDLAVIEALAAAVEARDVITAEHLDRVTKLATDCMAAIDSGLAANEEVSYGFMLHDIGKIGVPDAILGKPGPLGTQEWDVMRRHPAMGVKIVEPIGFSSTTTDIILCHHERWDGTGYPNNLVGDEIPISARAFAVADTYDAMTSDRPYRSALSHEVALETITAGAGKAYDPDVVEIFIDLKD
ncbi:MAG: HD domain-containing phosphohydrolase [Actinomycetota bacterium]